MSHRRKRKDAKSSAQPKLKSVSKVTESFVQGFAKFKDEIGNNDLDDLISKISGLQLLPSNQNHLIGLLTALEVISALSESGENKIRSENLSKALNQTLLAKTYVGSYEDPPANLFTENVIFHGGNYIVFPGLFPGGSIILSALLDSIFMDSNPFKKEFIDAVGASTVSLLTISKAIADRVAYGRYIDGIDETSDKIFVPDDEELESLGKAVSFTKSELVNLLSQLGLRMEFLNPFICQKKDIYFSGRNVENSLLGLSPVIELEGKYVIVPAMIVDSLIHFIILMGSTLNEIDNIALAYRDNLKCQTFENLTLLFHGASPFEDNSVEMNENEAIAEWMLKIDTDKLLYVQFISDDINNFDKSSTEWDNQSIIEECDRRRARIEEILKNRPETRSSNFLTLRIVGTIGRSCILGLRREMTLEFTAEDFHILARIGDLEGISFWKYACSLDALARNGVRIISFFPLDTFAFYYQNHRTFNKEETKPNSIILPPNLGRVIRAQVLRSSDHHAVQRDDPARYVSVVLQFESETAPIYIPDNPFNETFGLMVGGFLQPVWISPWQSKELASPKNWESQFHFIELVAHWVATIAEDLRPHLNALNNNPIEISVGTIEIGESTVFSQFEEEQMKGGAPTGIPIILRYRGIEYVSKRIDLEASLNDGTFDYRFVECLLNCISELLEKFGIDSLTSDECKKIVNAHFSLNRKSAIVQGSIIGNASLIEQGLPELRLVQEHDLALVTEKLVAQLTDEFNLGQFYSSQEETNEICHKAVDYLLTTLRTCLSSFSWKDLMKCLIQQNEAICHLRAKRIVSVEQYINLYGFSIGVKESHIKENPRIDASAIALRALIEISAAEPVNGDRSVSLTDLDELMAISERLIMWAELSDLIHLGISKPRIQLLESGMIQIIDEVFMELWQSFYEVKTMEDLERAYNIEQASPDSSLPVTDNEMQEAYRDEFGLTLSELANLFAGMTIKGFENEDYCFNSISLKEEICGQLEWSSEKFETALPKFSLFPRERWDSPPEGYCSYDIYPWRFNRRLSYLRRPVISNPLNEQGCDLLFGPRQIEESIKHLIFLVETGRFISRDATTKMAVLVGKINDHFGTKFTGTVWKWFEEQKDFKIDKKIEIGPNGNFYCEIDLGDIDVLAIDLEESVVILAECKHLHQARNPHEIAQEIGRMIYDVDTEEDIDKSSIKKHMRRSDWVRKNLEAFLKRYGLTGPFEVLPLIITSIEIPSKYIIKPSIEFISFSTLRKEGLKRIRKHYHESGLKDQ